MTPAPPPRITVLGAGSIGCHLGGLLTAVADVTLVGRPAAMAELRGTGLTLTRGTAPARHVPPTALRTATGADAAAGADAVLVTVKSADTGAAARDLAPHLDAATAVCSFQNGVRNVPLLRRTLPGRTVVAGMVPYNVARTGPGHLHQAGAGTLLLDDTAAGRHLAGLLARAGLDVRTHPDMRAVQYAKLLLNLNNAVNALSGLPLRDQLGQRAFRACLALCQREALAAFRAAGVTPARLTPLPPALTPHLLRLPDGLFRLASRSLAIDARARSSMWDDLRRGRRTEIDQLQGEVAATAARHGLPAPVSARVVELVHAAEAARPAAPWTGRALLADLTRSHRTTHRAARRTA